jgi:outer membrane lipoprotein SlyB
MPRWIASCNPEKFSMIKDLLRVLLVGSIVMAGMACASKRPVLSPNAQLEAMGAAAAQQDIDDCVQKGAAAGSTANPEGKVARNTAVGAAVGAAAGAVAGAVVGRAGAGAAMGAAGGSTGGLIRGIFGSRYLDPAQRQFVDQCLKEKGYEVIDWQ